MGLSKKKARERLDKMIDTILKDGGKLNSSVINHLESLYNSDVFSDSVFNNSVMGLSLSDLVSKSKSKSKSKNRVIFEKEIERIKNDIESLKYSGYSISKHQIDMLLPSKARSKRISQNLLKYVKGIDASSLIDRSRFIGTVVSNSIPDFSDIAADNIFIFFNSLNDSKGWSEEYKRFKHSIRNDLIREMSRIKNHIGKEKFARNIENNIDLLHDRFKIVYYSSDQNRMDVASDEIIDILSGASEKGWSDVPTDLKGLAKSDSSYTIIDTKGRRNGKK